MNNNLPTGMNKLIDKYKDIIESVHREYNDGVDYWIYLKDGFICSDTECGTIHEYNIKDCASALKNVIKVGSDK